MHFSEFLANYNNPFSDSGDRWGSSPFNPCGFPVECNKMLSQLPLKCVHLYFMKMFEEARFQSQTLPEVRLSVCGSPKIGGKWLQGVSLVWDHSVGYPCLTPHSICDRPLRTTGCLPADIHARRVTRRSTWLDPTRDTACPIPPRTGFNFRSRKSTGLLRTIPNGPPTAISVTDVCHLVYLELLLNGCATVAKGRLHAHNLLTLNSEINVCMNR